MAPECQRSEALAYDFRHAGRAQPHNSHQTAKSKKISVTS
jgi:hypothetical protein